MNNQKKILIVEDDESTLESLLIKFTHAHIDVVVAESGRAALAMLASDARFDLILLDLILPLGDGFWLLGEKKKNPALHDIPVVVISNLNQTEHVNRARELGASGYLVKANHSVSEIVSVVEHCLAGGLAPFDNPEV